MRRASTQDFTVCISLSTKQRQTGRSGRVVSMGSRPKLYIPGTIKTQIILVLFCFRAGGTVRVVQKVFFCFRGCFFMFHGQNTKLEFLQMVDNFSKANYGVLNSPKKGTKLTILII